MKSADKLNIGDFFLRHGDYWEVKQVMVHDSITVVSTQKENSKITFLFFLDSMELINFK